MMNVPEFVPLDANLFENRVEFSDASEEYILTNWTCVKVTGSSVDSASKLHPRFNSVSSISRALGLPVIRIWADKNTTKRWAARIHYFYFESQEDALMFKLRWS